MNTLLRIVLLACVVFPLLGCGAGKGGKKAISGTVTLKGQPLDHGTITFLALPDSQTHAAAALIQQGSYAIPAEQGLPAGAYRVKLSAIEEFDISPAEYAAGKTPPPPKERIPAKYNAASQELVEVLEAGANKFDFQIE